MSRCVIDGQAMDTLAYAPAMSSPIATPERRVAELRRAFMRCLRRKPTMIERTAVERAARLTARAEMAALDPSATLDDVVRLDNCAERARSKLSDLIGAPLGKRRQSPNSLALLGNGHG
jgi:hypothetical protein